MNKERLQIQPDEQARHSVRTKKTEKPPANNRADDPQNDIEKNSLAGFIDYLTANEAGDQS